MLKAMELWVIVGIVVWTIIAIILFIIGLVFMLGPNHYDENIAIYNDGTSHFLSSVAPQLYTWNAEIEYNNQTTHIPIVSEQIPFKGTLGDIDNVTTVYGKVILAQYNAGSLLNFRFPTINFTFGTRIHNVQMRSERLMCTKYRCTSNCDKSDFYCNEASMISVCQNKYPTGHWISDNSNVIFGCQSFESCGRCEYQIYQQSTCVVLSNNSNKWKLSTEHDSCNYPFNGQLFSPIRPSTYRVEFRVDTDSYLLAGKLTKGTFDFGMSSTVQITVGFILFMIGSCMLGFEIFFFFGKEIARNFYYSTKSNTKHTTHRTQNYNPPYGNTTMEMQSDNTTVAIDIPSDSLEKEQL